MIREQSTYMTDTKDIDGLKRKKKITKPTQRRNSENPPELKYKSNLIKCISQ